MGFSYSCFGLCCDFCDHDKSTRKNIYKLKCPFGYCQDWAICDKCRKLGKHKFSSCGMPNDPEKKDHKLCQRLMAEFEHEQKMEALIIQ